MKNYRDQTPKISCANCIHLWNEDIYEGPNYFCTHGITTPKEIEELRENYKDEWHDLEDALRANDRGFGFNCNGICDEYESSGIAK